MYPLFVGTGQMEGMPTILSRNENADWKRLTIPVRCSYMGWYSEWMPTRIICSRCWWCSVMKAMCSSLRWSSERASSMSAAACVLVRSSSSTASRRASLAWVEFAMSSIIVASFSSSDWWNSVFRFLKSFCAFLSSAVLDSFDFVRNWLSVSRSLTCLLSALLWRFAVTRACSCSSFITVFSACSAVSWFWISAVDLVAFFWISRRSFASS